MKTVRITIDESLLRNVDQTSQSLNITRSTFIRKALTVALRQYQLFEMEKRHAAGYVAHPVEPEEFDVWFDEQSWDSMEQ